MKNSTKTSSIQHGIKRLIEPLAQLLRRHKTRRNTYKQSPQPEYYREDDDCPEVQDNLANELLENEIFEEMDECEANAAISVYHNGHMDIVPVFRGQRYIPVHFARTEAGTFFWTSMVGPDCDVNLEGDHNPITANQMPELQRRCRWAQA